MRGQNETIPVRYHMPGLGVACAAGVASGILSVAVDLLRIVAAIQRPGPLTLGKILAEGRVFHFGAVLVGVVYCGVFVALYLGLLAITEISRRIHMRHE